MIRVRSVTMKNFLSVGNTTQAVNLDEHGLTLVLGENVDLGGGGSRNGVGKTTLIQAICYAWFGEPLTNIKKDNLINKINQKVMSVSLDYVVDGKYYRIERGRKPNFLRFYVNDGLVNAEGTDEAHGESKHTQEEIIKSIGMSHLLFKHIVALHTKTVPFLGMSAKDQRNVIEELLGITQLSQKAEKLKESVKQTKDEIKGEEIRLKVLIDSNERVQKNINELHFKNKMWDKEHANKLEKFTRAIEQLKTIDIETEIESHRKMADWTRVSSLVGRLEKDAARAERAAISAEGAVSRLATQIEAAADHKCHTCGQEVHDAKHDEIISDLGLRYERANQDLVQANEELYGIAVDLEAACNELAGLGSAPNVSYDTIEQALNHRHTLDKLESDYLRESTTDSPYLEQIANLSTTSLQEVSYEYLNELVRLKQHQDYLQTLLTDKNSFIRKKIINQNLSYLNHRLNAYLEKIQLPHEVTFQSDLSVEIQKLGKDYDFEQLSNGEQNRLVLALAWGFRDVWETMNKPLNILMIDELVDSGMDPVGMDLALEILKKTARERNKNIFLISHNDGLTSRVPRILLVQKENNFTTFVTDTEQND